MTIPQALALGLEHQQAGRFEHAESVCRQVLAVQPENPQAMLLLARIAMQMGQPAAAAPILGRVVELTPQDIDARYLLGLSLRQAGATADAIDVFAQLIQLEPQHFDAHNALGDALQAAGRVEEAVDCYRNAMHLRADSAEAQNNLASAYQEMGKVSDAISSYRAALSRSPQNSAIHYNLALALLSDGQYLEGFAEHEWRWQVAQLGLTQRNFPHPRWVGEDPRGKRLLLFCEQGFGDSIQMLRYVPILEQMGATVIVQLPQELMRLARSLPGSARFIAFGDAPPEVDLQCPLLSVPLAMKTTVNSIPTAVPYLHAEPAAAGEWRMRINVAAGDKKKIGIAWAGRREHWNDRNRSIPAEILAPLFDLSEVTFFSVQKSDAAARLNNLVDGTADLHDFADTAAMIDALDLVISVDTAVAHLAGAMGKPTWLLLPFAADWRWLQHREDSPWYPTMKLFRQSKAGNWMGVVQRVIERIVHL
jgi:Flp pilus assembly protein TadD